MLVVLNVVLAFSATFVSHLAESSIPPELQSYFDSGVSVLEAENDSAFSLIYGWTAIYLSLDLLTVVAATGLCLGRRWGRTLFLLCFAVVVLLTPFHGISISAGGWTSVFGFLRDTTEGMILALAYFSHLRRMFERPPSDE